MFRSGLMTALPFIERNLAHVNHDFSRSSPSFSQYTVQFIGKIEESLRELSFPIASERQNRNIGSAAI
jgi:hypothetical protein